MILGIEHGSYNVSEGIGSIEVCVQVKDGVPQSLLQLSFTTVDGTATGNQCIFQHLANQQHISDVEMNLKHCAMTVCMMLSCNILASLVIVSADYTNTTADLRFGPSSRNRCVQIPVINDMVPEAPEHFRVMLAMATPLPGIVLTPHIATIVINDDDGKFK